MRIGHVLLATDSGTTADQLTALVRALSRHGVEQHALLGDARLLREIGACDRVSVGPRVRTPIMACCLMPDVDIAHMHDLKSAQTGLLLTLTRSVPYIVTLRSATSASSNPVTRSIYRRARCIVCQSDEDAADMRGRCPDAIIETIRPAGPLGPGETEAMSPERIAAAYMKLYRRSIDSGRLPSLML